MKKMRAVVALLLVATMVLGLSACGKKKSTYDLTVWCAENLVELTKQQIENFNKENKDGIEINADVNAVGEGEAATKVIESIEDSADIYFFASDQLARLLQAKGLAKLGKNAADTVKSENTEGSVRAVTAGSDLYAFPVTADNGFFLYYDKSVLSEEDVKTIEGILAKCEATGKNFAFDLGNAWYNAAFFFGAGCVSEWTCNDKGDPIGVNDTFNSDKGLIAAKGMKKVFDSKAFINGADASAKFQAGAAAVVSGTWEYDATAKVLGNNIAATKLPTFTVDGQTYQLGSYSGYKFLGVKPQADADKAAAAQKLALYLTGEKCQTERFEALAWGPSNLKAKASEKVKANAGQQAIAAQEPYAIMQQGIHGGWWDIGNALGAEIKECDGTDAALKTALSNYKTKLDALFTMSDEVKNAFTVIGKFATYNWDKDIEMEANGNVWKTKEAFDLKAGDEFKVRQGLAWDVAYGLPAGQAKDSGNYVVETAGTYYIQLDAGTGTISLIAK